MEQKSVETKYIELLERQVRLLEAKSESGDNPGPSPTISRLRSLSMAGQAGDGGGDGGGKGDIGQPGEGMIQYRMKRFNNDGFLVEEAHDPKKLEPTKAPQEQAVATVMMYFDDKRTHTDTEVKIESAAARAVLQEKLKHYPGYHWENPHLSLFAPFQPLIHNWDALEAATQTRPQTQGASDLAEILRAVKEAKEVKDYFETRDAMEGSMSFEFLWTVFRPGELVILPSSFMKQPQVFIVRDAFVVQMPRGDRKRYLTISCWGYDWDGSVRSFKRVGIELKIEAYKGQRLVTSLPCYPLSCFPGNQGELRMELIERGRMFRKLCISPQGKQMFEYDGQAHYRGTGVRQAQGGGRPGGLADDASYIHPFAPFGRLSRSMSSELAAKSGRQLNMKGRVMVDFESYLRHGPNGPIPMGELILSDDDEDDECRCPKCMAEGGPKDNQRYEWDDVSDSAVFHDDQFLICPPRVLGYHLMEKKWVELLVTKVNPIDGKRNDDAFEKLQLAPKQKRLIKKLVTSHTGDKTRNTNSPRGQMNDLAKGKGEGLVILLHGPPGVGKTLTAESIAQVTGKPLFPMGVGDVTTDPSMVERRLEQMFELAATWQAVMLFDEADVFLESRASTTDVTRVGLVSVLLRVLEYYQGILILTTNRIRSFDIAVQSRINLAIQFKDLSEKQKANIFENLIKQLGDDFVDNRREIIKWFKSEDDDTSYFSALNGRQIRNIVFSAASLAGDREGDEKRLRLDDIKLMLEETYKFQQHLQELTKSAREKNE